jgi:hypothetical protein
MSSGGLSGAPLVSGRWLLETFHPLDERVEEPAHALSCLLVGQVARLHVELLELLAGVGDEHLGLRHDVGGGVQEDLAEHHLAPRRSRPTRARSKDAHRFVAHGGGGAQGPVERGRQDTGDGVVVLGGGDEDGVGLSYLLFWITYRRGVTLVLYVLVEEGNLPELLVRLDGDALGCQLPRGSDEAAVEGGPPQAARQVECP